MNMFAKKLIFNPLSQPVFDTSDLPLPSAKQLTSKVLSLSYGLLEKASITPNEAGCLGLVENRLKKIGMLNERMDSAPVSNLFSSFGNHKPTLAFVGHVDVVPPGDLSNWETEPFKPVEKDGFLYGRGSVDMKTAVAAMVVALEEFEKLGLEKNIDIAIMLTSDEEGEATQGIKHVVDCLQERGQIINWALVGEPSSEKTLGDSIKIGRRGSLTARVILKGKQGHVGYPAQIENPVKHASKILNKLQHKQWDLPSRFFPATSLQVVKFQCDSGADNISPASVKFDFNMRFSPKQTVVKLKKYIEKQLKKSGQPYEVEWIIDAEPFITRRSSIRQVVEQVTLETNQSKPKLSTAGGTSDGRFLAKTGTQVVELGLCNKRIHQANERAPVKDLGKLALMYLKILVQMNQRNQ